MANPYFSRKDPGNLEGITMKEACVYEKKKSSGCVSELGPGILPFLYQFRHASQTRCAEIFAGSWE